MRRVLMCAVLSALCGVPLVLAADPAGAAEDAVLAPTTFTVQEPASGTFTEYAYTLTIEDPAAEDEVIVTVDNGTATRGTDFEVRIDGLLANPSRTVAADETHQIVVRVFGDNQIGEPNETFQLAVEVTGVGHIAGSPFAFEIRNFTGTGPGFIVVDTSVVEGNTDRFIDVEVRLTAAVGVETRVEARTVPGTALDGADYLFSAAVFTFAPGELTKTLPVRILADTIRENDETFQVQLLSSVGAPIRDGTGTVTIIDDDNRTLSVNDTSASEGGNARFTVTLSSIASTTVSVVYTTADGSARAGSDYVPVSGTLTFPPGTTVQTVDVAVLDDTVQEGPETFSLVLSNAIGATIADSSGLATIAASDAPPPPPPDGCPTGASLNQKVVCSMYMDFLGRGADPSGLALFSGLLDRGVPRRAVADAITTSPEYRTRVLENLYQRMLGRGIDPFGLAAWSAELARGATIERVITGIAGSAEYFARAGGDRATFVRQVFQHLLGRSAEPAAVQFFTGLLASGMSREQLARGVLDSLEYRQGLVVNSYTQLLNRAPDPFGLVTWTAALGRGLGQRGLHVEIAASAEYAQLAVSS